MDLSQTRGLIIQQVRELWELVGFETRNKYKISDEQGQILAYAAEQQKGFFAFLARQFLGHWRSYEIHFFNEQRQILFTVHHPFRFFFQKFTVKDSQGRILGEMEQNFSLISKKFSLRSQITFRNFTMKSPIWKIWTFPITDAGRPVALIEKKWSGLLKEVFTDADQFRLGFQEASLSNDDRKLMLASAVFVDLQYFEAKAD
ncbi:MAG: phospholipid scramblase-related protein [Pseudobdellovibrionaceae bacterium]